MDSRDTRITPDTQDVWDVPSTGADEIIGAGAFRFVTDQEGNQLDGSARYRVLGSLHMPGSWWSVGLYDCEGCLRPNADERYAFTSFNVIPEDDGTIVIDVAPERPENALNWLPSRQAEPFFLVIRLYRWGTQALDRVSTADLPRILRVEGL